MVHLSLLSALDPGFDVVLHIVLRGLQIEHCFWLCIVVQEDGQLTLGAWDIHDEVVTRVVL